MSSAEVDRAAEGHSAACLDLDRTEKIDRVAEPENTSDGCWAEEEVLGAKVPVELGWIAHEVGHKVVAHGLVECSAVGRPGCDDGGGSDRGGKKLGLDEVVEALDG